MQAFFRHLFNYDVHIVRQIEKYYLLYHSHKKLDNILGKLLFARIKKNNSCNIYPSCSLGNNIYIPHPSNITIGETSVLGNNIIIYPGVHLVSNFASKERVGKRRHPLINDNCILCTNSIIIGSISVGKNCIIAAGAVVTKNVPDNTIVTGVNDYKINRYDNLCFLQDLSSKTNRERILLFDNRLLHKNKSIGENTI